MCTTRIYEEPKETAARQQEVMRILAGAGGGDARDEKGRVIHLGFPGKTHQAKGRRDAGLL